ncbi:MAG: N-acetylglucosamine-6-phosphate deacetylase [Planctomycetota bacterium]
MTQPMAPEDPGWCDLQVNGAFGLDFNRDDWTPTQAAAAEQALLADGTSQALATVITAPWPQMIARVRRAARWCAVSDVLIGVHIEGPFLNPSPGYAGAHPAQCMCPASIDQASELLDASEGQLKLLTLAPEQDAGGSVTGWLANRGVVVAAGHSDATLDQLDAGLDRGLKLFTHLGNGCPSRLDRHDNIIQRVLSRSDRLSVSLIADGHHVPGFALRNYLSLIPSANVIIVSDAISAAGMPPGDYSLGDQIVHVDDQGAAWSHDRSHFAGSACTLKKAWEFLVGEIGLPETEVQRWLTSNPRRLLRQSS